MVTSSTNNALRDSFAERIALRTLILDGGLSTQLERLGASFDSPLWTGQALLDNPELIERAHRDFVEAGADVVITASYQISRYGFEQLGRTAAEADAALRASIEVAFAAVAGTNALVAASVGPYGAILHDGSEYRGNYGVSRDALEKFHAERIAVLAEAAPDLFAIETIPDLLEVEAVVAALESTTDIPAWLSVTVGPDGRLWAGQSLAQVAAAVAGHDQIVALGLNCLDPNITEAAIAELRAATSLPIVVYPNGGGVWSAETGKWSVPHSGLHIETCQTWVAAGAGAVGGCCGVSASDIATVSHAWQ
jgi:homocysteine S-methyltransferase